MKKIALCSLLMIALFAPLAFAQYGPPSGGYPPPPTHGQPERGMHSNNLPWLYLSLNLPFPVQWEFFSSNDNEVARAWSWAWALGLDVTALFTQRIGVHVSADACFPQIRTSFYKDGSEFTYWGMTSFGLSFFAGPSIAAIRTSRILFAVSPGVHIAGLFGVTRDSASASILFGLGASAEVAVNITPSWFVRASLDVTCDFAGVERNAPNAKFYGINETVLNFSPAVGAGYMF